MIPGTPEMTEETFGQGVPADDWQNPEGDGLTPQPVYYVPPVLPQATPAAPADERAREVLRQAAIDSGQYVSINFDDRQWNPWPVAVEAMIRFRDEALATPIPASSPAQGEADLPDVLPGYWSGVEGRKMAESNLRVKSRSFLAKGDLTDLALANGVFMASRDDLDLIAWQTAAKERIRWLSAHLAAALATPVTPAPSEQDSAAILADLARNYDHVVRLAEYVLSLADDARVTRTRTETCLNHPARQIQEILDGDPLCHECCLKWEKANAF